MAFGNSSNLFRPGAQSNTNREDLPKAEFWLNVGYMVTVEIDEIKETRFVSLPIGIALDTMEQLNTNSGNASWSMFQQARNQLHVDIMEIAKTLKAGEEVILGGDASDSNQLCIQLRRVKGPSEAVNPADNPFARRASTITAS